MDESQTTIGRLSKLPEEYALEYFWRMVRVETDRLSLLQLMTNVTIARPPTWNRAQIRAEHRGRRGCLLDRKRCFACRSGVQLYFHHIIEVQHGGSNAPRNQVAICLTCHRYLHPWLQEEPVARRRGGFESVAAMAARCATLDREPALIEVDEDEYDEVGDISDR